jgi:hypothetical protein
MHNDSARKGAGLAHRGEGHSDVGFPLTGPKELIAQTVAGALLVAVSLLSACGSGGGGSGDSTLSGAGQAAGAASGPIDQVHPDVSGLTTAGGPTLGTADAAKLAKYDLIDIDRFRYNSIGSNTWSGHQGVNPEYPDLSL